MTEKTMQIPLKPEKIDPHIIEPNKKSRPNKQQAHR
jgi:hypothetical protein